MANPTPIYTVTYNGTQLPGYLINEDIPLSIASANTQVLNREGGLMSRHGANFRDVSLTFRVLSRLGNNSSSLQHLADCMTQWKDALAIVSRVEGSAQLFIDTSSRYLDAIFVESTAPLEAPVFRRITYTLKFIAQPWFISSAFYGVNQGVSGDTSMTFFLPGPARKSYPVFFIPVGITSITISHAVSGKSFTISGTHADVIVVDCEKLTVTNLTDGSNAIQYLTSGPDFGMWYLGSDIDDFTVDITAVTGSGTVSVTVQPRYER